MLTYTCGFCGLLLLVVVGIVAQLVFLFLDEAGFVIAQPDSMRGEEGLLTSNVVQPFCPSYAVADSIDFFGIG